MPRKKRRRQKAAERQIAETRVDELVRLAEWAALSGRLDLAERYVGIAARLSQRHRLDMAPGLRDRRCRVCEAYLLPGTSARVRVRSGHRAITCARCGTTRRFVYAP